MRGFSIIIFLILQISVFNGVYGNVEPSVDELLEAAASVPTLSTAYGGPSGMSGGVRFTSDGTIAITELDIAESVPCETSPTPPLGSPVPVAGDGRYATPLRGLCTTINTEDGSKRRRRKRNLVRDTRYRWPTTTLPYDMDTTAHTSSELNVFNQVIEDYKKYTCVRLVNRTTETKNFIKIIKDQGCWSYVGLQSPNGQEMSLGEGCLYRKKTAIHEFLHALGVFHEQSRPGRDEFVQIIWENIRSGLSRNFNEKFASQVLLFGTPYDYRSVMHYSRRAFSVDRVSDTIKTKQPKFQDIIGRAPTFSFWDLYVLHKAYTCDGNCSSANSCPSNSSYRDQNCKCMCQNDQINRDIPVVECDSGSTSTSTTARTTTPNTTTTMPHTTTTMLNTTTTMPDTTTTMLDTTTTMPDTTTTMPHTTTTIPNTTTTIPNTTTTMPHTTTTIPNTTTTMLNTTTTMPNTTTAMPSTISTMPTTTTTTLAECRIPGKVCRCQIQGPSACRFIPNSFCNYKTGACNCFPDFITGTRYCTSLRERYISDGALVSPFSNQAGAPIRFAASKGNEPLEQFGLQRNGYRLTAVGNGVGSWASLVTPSLKPSTWCIQFGFNINYASLEMGYSFDGGQTWLTLVRFTLSSRSSVFYPRWYRYYTTGANILFRFRAAGFSGYGLWSVNLDPVKVYECP